MNRSPGQAYDSLVAKVKKHGCFCQIYVRELLDDGSKRGLKELESPAMGGLELTYYRMCRLTIPGFPKKVKSYLMSRDSRINMGKEWPSTEHQRGWGNLKMLHDGKHGRG